MWNLQASHCAPQDNTVRFLGMKSVYLLSCSYYSGQRGNARVGVGRKAERE